MKGFLRLLSLTLCALMLLPLLGGCGAVGAVSVAKGGEATLAILLPAKPAAQVLYARDLFAGFVQNELGITLDGDPAQASYRLLLGNTGEEKSIALAQELDGEGYLMRAWGKDLVVVASNDAFLYDAVRALLQNEGWVRLDRERGKMRISASLDARGAGDTTSLRYLFTQTDTLTSTATHYANLPNPEGLPTEQGGCFDGTYYYQAFLKKHTASNEAENIVRVGKFDYKTKELVAYSEELPLNHANDITYCASTGELYVAHNNPNRTRVSVLSAETLQLLRTEEIDARIYGITYCAQRNAFAVALSDSQNMRMLNADLTLADDRVLSGGARTPNHTTQGICSDDTFIYHVLWDGARKSKPTFQNEIVVYDFYGNLVGVIHFAIGVIEPENISIGEGGQLLVVASTKNGGALYEVRPVGPEAVTPRE